MDGRRYALRQVGCRHNMRVRGGGRDGEGGWGGGEGR